MGHLLISDFDFGGILLGVQSASDLEPGFGVGSRYQPSHGRVIHKGLTSAMLADLAKESVFDRVPFGGPSGIMADGYGQLVGIG